MRLISLMELPFMSMRMRTKATVNGEPAILIITGEKCAAFYSHLRISGWRSFTLTESVWMRLVMRFTGRGILQRELMKGHLILSNA